MSKPQDRIISKREDGTWVNQRKDSERATSLHKTQADAINAAKDNLRNQGGGELIIKGENGKIRQKDTVPPGNDPNPPKDKK